MHNAQQRQGFDAARGLNRRDFMRLGGTGLLGLGMAGDLSVAACGEAPPATQPAKAKSVIQLFMPGGLGQHDTFDPKPDAPPKIRSPFKPIDTNVPGIRIGEVLPLLAKMADKYAILRTLTMRDWGWRAGGHAEGQYMMMTNSLLPALATSTHPSARLIYPCVGTIVGMKKQQDGSYTGDLPPYITLPGWSGMFGLQTEGFLGPEFKAYEVPGDPSAANFSVGLKPQEEQRLQQRRPLLEAVDSLAVEVAKQQAVQAATSLRQRSLKVLMGESKKVFDLSQEKDTLRDRYGRHQFGQTCLLARRLVEYGVPFVTVWWWPGPPVRNGWDSHNYHDETVKLACPLLDQGVSALLEDLSQRGLLESTIVLCNGEQGKTPDPEPEPPFTKGRGHHVASFSGIVAGGGFKGGKVVGESDGEARHIQSRPIYPWDVWESVYKLLGINPSDKLPTPDGCVAYVSQAATGMLPRGGILAEIM